MTAFLLDTNVLSEFAGAGKPDPNMDWWVLGIDESLLLASVRTFAEILRGIELLPAGKRRTQLLESFAERLIPVSQSIADRWAVLAAKAQRMGIGLASIDGLIAATAMERNMTLVSRNVRDFAGLDLPILNPWTP